MARLEGVTSGGSLLARATFIYSRRVFGKIVRPLRIHALHTSLLWAYSIMEWVQQGAKRVPHAEKDLAGQLVALRIGCPF